MYSSVGGRCEGRRGKRRNVSDVCECEKLYYVYEQNTTYNQKQTNRVQRARIFETRDMRRRATLLTGNHHTSQQYIHANTHVTQSVAVTYALPNPLLHRGHHSNRRERGVSSAVEPHQSPQHIIEIPAPQSAERGDVSKCI